MQGLLHSLIIAAGATSNFIAIALNGGSMPADPGAWARAEWSAEGRLPVGDPLLADLLADPGDLPEFAFLLSDGADSQQQSDVSLAFGITAPLVTKADGTKFGKTAGGAIWLDAEQTSPFAFYQFWLNTDDRDIASMLRYFSLRPLPDIEQVIAEGERRPASRAGQRALAAELTDLVHGRETREHIEAASAALFGRGDLQVLPAQILRESTQDVPTVGLPAETSVVDAFLAAGLSDSKSAARRAIKEGGAYINNERVSDGETALPADRALHGRWLLLRRGKRSIAVVEVVG